MAYVAEVTIPIAKPQTLKLVFNNSTYKRLKEKTGLSVFDISQDPNLLKDPIVLCAALYCATRKHHPNVDEENLGDWLDELDTSPLFDVYGDVIKAFCVSFLEPSKRAEFLNRANKKAMPPIPTNADLVKAAKATTMMERAGKNTLSVP